MNIGKEILINASHVTHNSFGDTYEFIINEELKIIDSVQISSLTKTRLTPIKEPEVYLEEMLFELNHVRVNPRVDNKYIIGKFIEKLEKVGISVTNTPDNDSISLCYKPLGEINSSVRFYVNHKKNIVFMSPNQPKLRCASKNNSIF